MASKLELRFTDVGTIGATLTIRTGITYTFKQARLGFREVGVGNNPKITPTQLAQNFKDAFNADDNFTGEVIITYSATALDENGVEQTPSGTLDGILTLEHFDNDYFAGFADNAGFIIGTLSTTIQQNENTLQVALSQSPTDVCGRFNLNIQSNVKSGRLTIELPVGNVIDVAQTGISGAFTYDLNRIRPSLATGGIVKLYETEFTGTVLKSVLFTAPGVLNISDVIVKGSPFGSASATIQAPGSNLLYSLDNVSFQGSKEYTGLLEGSYTAYVKDAFGCVKSKSFVVTADQVTGITAPPFIKVPIHNSLRGFDRSGDSFLNYSATETPAYIQIAKYYQDYLLGDVIRTQFKSSYPVNRAYIYDCDEVETELTVVQKSDNISRINIYEGNYGEYDGRLAVYFDSGDIYNSDGSVKGTHSLSGLLPDWYEEGMFLNIEGYGATVIDRIEFDEDAEIKYAVTLKEPAGVVLGKKITSIHTAHPYEVYEFETNFSTIGKFIIKLDYGAGVYFFEPVKIWESLPDKYLKVEWFSKDNNDILYGTGIRQMRRLKWSRYFTYLPKDEKETFSPDTSVELVNSKSNSSYEISFAPMPMEMARGLSFGFNNSTSVVINGAVFVCDGAFKAEPFANMVKVTAELTLTDQTMKGQQEVSDAISARFLITEEDANGVKFLKL